jgi:hypothetical protein
LPSRFIFLILWLNRQQVSKRNVNKAGQSSNLNNWIINDG